MREIKFRAWNNHLNVMTNDIHVLDSLNEYLSKEQYDCEQFTGLKDKNGVDIYEGDIIKAHKVGGYILKYEVFYDKRQAAFCVNIQTNSRVKSTLNTACDRIVIGNIHENKDLL